MAFKASYVHFSARTDINDFLLLFEQEQLKRVIKMNKVNPKLFTEGTMVDDDALAMARIASAAFSITPKQPTPVSKGKRTSTLPKPVVD